MFESFNKDVVDAFARNKRRLTKNAASRQVRALLDEVGASAFKLLPHPFLFPADEFEMLARRARCCARRTKSCGICAGTARGRTCSRSAR